jgi:hypothetical protein
MQESPFSSEDSSRHSRDPFRRAFSFREGLTALLQEGFDGMDYLSADEVLQLLEEVLAFIWTFFKGEHPVISISDHLRGDRCMR